MSPTTKPTIDDLPVEMIWAIFKCLSLKDLVICSMVNKRWQSIYAGFRLAGLAVIDDYELKKGRNLERRIEARCSLETFNCLAKKPLLSNLKHLSLYGYRFKIDPNKLKEFRQLEHLEFDLACFSRKKVDLNLLKLKVLVANFRNWDTELCINCPELNVLVYDEWQDRNLLEVKHPETIRKLDTGMVGLKLTRFESVECVVTERVKMIRKATLLSLPRLKELRYNQIIEIALLDFGIEGDRLDRMKEALREFLDDVKALRGVDFKFRFAGFQLTRMMLDQIDLGVQVAQINGRRFESVASEYIYMKNCKLIDPDGTLDFMRSINYPRLMANAPEELPWCIFRQFTRIDLIRAKEAIQDENHFLRFLRSQSRLKTLQLYKLAPLNQGFYNQLPIVAHSLTLLDVRRYEENKLNEENEPQLNFDFIRKLSRLTYLAIYKNFLTFESLTSLFRSSGELEQAYFCFRLKGLKEKSFFISKDRGSKVWNVQNRSRREDNTGYYTHYFVPSVFANPEEVLNYFQRLQNELLSANLVKTFD